MEAIVSLGSRPVETQSLFIPEIESIVRSGMVVVRQQRGVSRK